MQRSGLVTAADSVEQRLCAAFAIRQTDDELRAGLEFVVVGHTNAGCGDIAQRTCTGEPSTPCGTRRNHDLAVPTQPR